MFTVVKNFKNIQNTVQLGLKNDALNVGDGEAIDRSRLTSGDLYTQIHQNTIQPHSENCVIIVEKT